MVNRKENTKQAILKAMVMLLKPKVLTILPQLNYLKELELVALVFTHTIKINMK